MRVDDFETGQVGCSALVAGVVVTGMLLESQHPLWILPLWGALYAVYRSVAATARVAACPGCARELRFASDVAYCSGCGDYFRVDAAALAEIEGDHETTGDGFELSLDMLGPLGEAIRLPWTDRCCACERPAVTEVELRPASVADQALGGAMHRVVTVACAFPCCDDHRTAVRTSEGALRFRHYRTWRELLDANRGGPGRLS